MGNLEQDQTFLELAATKGISPATAWPRRVSDNKSTVGRRWYAGYSPAESASMYECLRGAGIEVYTPQIWIMRAVPRHKLSPNKRDLPFQIKEPTMVRLFPSYPFLKVDLGDRRWHDVLRIIGPLGLVSTEQGASPILDDDIRALRGREVDGVIPGKTTLKELPFKVGETVAVVEGAFAGKKGIVDWLPETSIEDLAETARIGLLVPMLGQRCHVEMNIGAIVRP